MTEQRLLLTLILAAGLPIISLAGGIIDQAPDESTRSKLNQFTTAMQSKDLRGAARCLKQILDTTPDEEFAAGYAGLPEALLRFADAQDRYNSNRTPEHLKALAKASDDYTKATDRFTAWASSYRKGANEQTTVNDSKAEALRGHPDLGVEGSPLNEAFILLHNERKSGDPSFFKKANWPLLLAEETAESLRPRPGKIVAWADKIVTSDTATYMINVQSNGRIELNVRIPREPTEHEIRAEVESIVRIAKLGLKSSPKAYYSDREFYVNILFVDRLRKAFSKYEEWLRLSAEEQSPSLEKVIDEITEESSKGSNLRFIFRWNGNSDVGLFTVSNSNRSLAGLGTSYKLNEIRELQKLLDEVPQLFEQARLKSLQADEKKEAEEEAKRRALDLLK